MNSKSSTFGVYRTIPLHQPNEDGTTASVYYFSHEFVAIATDNSQYAELNATTLSECSGTNRNKLCRKGFSTTTDETLLCPTSLFYEYSIPALRNSLVDSVLLPEAPQASYLADGLHHVISRTACLQVKNDTDGLPVSISTLQCQACLIRPSGSSTLTFSHEAGSFASGENNDQRGSSHSSPTNFTLLHDNFSFHQPCFSRLHAYADCFLTGMCIHDYFSFVFQYQFYALPASVATFLETPTTVLPRRARPIPSHCS